jgi:hypothetical protein
MTKRQGSTAAAGFTARLKQAKTDGGARGAKLIAARLAGGETGMPPLTSLARPAHLAFAALQNPVRPPEIDALVAGCQAQIAVIDAQQDALIALARQETGGNNDDFIARMNDARAQAKQQINQTIDNTYDQLNRIGQQHPESQNLIVQAMGQVAALGASAVGVIENAFNSAISAAQSAIEAIASAAEAAAEAVKEAAESVGDGFKSIFSGW